MEAISPFKAWTQKSQNTLFVKAVTRAARLKEGGYTDSP